MIPIDIYEIISILYYYEERDERVSCRPTNTRPILSIPTHLTYTNGTKWGNVRSLHAQNKDTLWWAGVYT